MCGGEGAAGTGRDQGGHPSHGTGFAGEDLQVMIEFQDVVVLVGCANVVGDSFAVDEDLDDSGADPPSGVGDGNGVVALPEADLGLVVGLDRDGVAGLEDVSGQGRQFPGLGGGRGADGDRAGENGIEGK